MASHYFKKSVRRILLCPDTFLADKPSEKHNLFRSAKRRNFD